MLTHIHSRTHMHKHTQMHTSTHTYGVHCDLNNHSDCDLDEECQLGHITDESSAQTQMFGVHVCTRSMKEMQFLFSQRPGIHTQTQVHSLLSSQNTPAHTCIHISECNTQAHTCTQGVSLSQHIIQHRIIFALVLYGEKCWHFANQAILNVFVQDDDVFHDHVSQRLQAECTFHNALSAGAFFMLTLSGMF